MDPVIAGSLVSAGKNLIQGISTCLTPDNEGVKVPRGAFSSELEKAHAVQSADSVHDLDSLRELLIKDPQVAAFLEKNPDCQIYMEKRADGSVQFLSSSGETLVLDKESQTNQFANNYIDLCLEENKNLTSLRPDSVTFDHQA